MLHSLLAVSNSLSSTQDLRAFLALLNSAEMPQLNRDLGRRRGGFSGKRQVKLPSPVGQRKAAKAGGVSVWAREGKDSHQTHGDRHSGVPQGASTAGAM